MILLQSQTVAESSCLNLSDNIVPYRCLITDLQTLLGQGLMFRIGMENDIKDLDNFFYTNYTHWEEAFPCRMQEPALV